MKLHEVVRIVEGISYKPGHKLRLHSSPEHPENSVKLYITSQRDDANKRDGSLIEIGSFLMILCDKFETPKQLQEFIRDWLIKYETHELDEWLLFDGLRVFDPHEDERHEPVNDVDPLNPYKMFFRDPALSEDPFAAQRRYFGAFTKESSYPTIGDE